MDKIRDLRDKFFQVDDEYLNGYAKLCGIHATGVYLSLCRHANKEQQCFPSKKLVAEELAISERGVYTALRKLSEWNIIKIESQGRKETGAFNVTLYTLLDKKVWKPKPNHGHDMPQANGAVGTESASPQANDDTHRRHTVPNKETHNNHTHIKETQSIDEVENSFNLFWNAYPRKVGRIAAFSSWKKSKLPPTAALLAALEKQSSSEQWKRDDGKFIPHPATWLNQGRWDDEVPVKKPLNDKYKKYAR